MRKRELFYELVGEAGNSQFIKVTPVLCASKRTDQTKTSQKSEPLGISILQIFVLTAKRWPLRIVDYFRNAERLSYRSCQISVEVKESKVFKFKLPNRERQNM